MFDQAFDRWDIEAVVVHESVRDYDQLSSYLEALDFEEDMMNGYIVWVRE